MIWNIEGVLIYSVFLSDHGKVVSLFLSEDNMHMIVLQEKMVSYWQMYNLSIMFQINNLQPACCMAVSHDEKFIVLGQGNAVIIEENPLASGSSRFLGENTGSYHQFMKFIVETIKNNQKTNYKLQYNR